MNSSTSASATPNSFIPVGFVTGLTAGQTLVGLDFRPANGQLYGLAVSSGIGQLYTLNPNTAIATPLPSSFPLLSTDTSISFGFDPVADDVRVITNNNENLRINPTTAHLLPATAPLARRRSTLASLIATTSPAPRPRRSTVTISPTTTW